MSNIIQKDLVGDFSSVDNVDMSYVMTPAEIENNFDNSMEKEVRQERIRRLFADKKNVVISDLLSGLNTARDWDRCYETCDHSFFNSLNLDHDSISEVAMALIIQAQKTKKHIPDAWKAVARGAFNWEKEAEYQNMTN